RLFVTGLFEAVGQRVFVDRAIQVQQLLDSGIQTELLKMGQPGITTKITKYDQSEDLPVPVAAVRAHPQVQPGGQGLPEGKLFQQEIRKRDQPAKIGETAGGKLGVDIGGFTGDFAYISLTMKMPPN